VLAPVLQRRSFPQLRLHALEALAGNLTAAGRWGEAAAAARAAVRGEPLRETSHAALIRVFLAEGNVSEAFREFASYQELLHDELGFEPTPGCAASFRTRGTGNAPVTRRRNDEM